MMPVHISFCQMYTRFAAGLHHLRRFGAVEGNRLLTEHMLARFRCADHPLPVKMIRKRNIDSVNLLIGEQLLIAAVSLLDAKLLGYGAALCKPPARHRRDNTAFRFLNCRHD
ncbi:hypothetical protein D3C73_1309270 [compost metagenome]